MRLATTRLLFANWDAARGERAAPERRDLDPGGLCHALPDAFLLEVDPARAHPFRLAGARLCALAGRALRGTGYLALWPEEHRIEAGGIVSAVLDDGVGVVAGVEASSAAGATLNLELILLPLRHRGATHARLVGALSPAHVPAWLGRDPLAGLRLRSMRVIRPVREACPPLGAPSRPVAGLDAAGQRRRWHVVAGGRADRTADERPLSRP